MTSTPERTLHPLRGHDHAQVLHEALAVRRDGGIPLVGDERWDEEKWDNLMSLARQPDLPGNAAWATLTSGSTGNPRIVLRTQRSWDVSYPILDRLAGIEPSDVMLIPVPPVSSMATYAASHADHTGFRFRVPTTRRIAPTDIDRATIMHGTPWHLREVTDLLDAGRPSNLRTVLVGGDRLPDALRRRAEDHGLNVISYFGAAELSLVAVDTGSGLRAFPGVELDIRDGLLWVRTEQRALTTLGSGGSLRTEGEWSTVGDRAQLPDGRLELLGRDDDAIQTAGATVIPAQVEDVLNSLPGVTASLVLGVPHPSLGEHVAAAVEVGPADPDSTLQRLRTSARQELTSAQMPRQWKLVQRLPRTGSGKIRRLTPEEFRELS